MSYQALYRKWRPKTFDEVKGQDAIITTLKNQVASGRIGHAYLFCGTRGTGKTSVAKIFARAVNCEKIHGDGAGVSFLEDQHADGGGQGTVPCNECPTCLSILNESSMNVMEIDAASNNGVDNIREIREQVQYPPTQGRYKVFIIDEVHMLSTGAFNALLKTLEEPPEYVIFILATTEVHKIPVTVLSRCQRYDFRRISAATIIERLKELTAAEGIVIDERALAYIAKAADGAMRDALSLLDECIAFHPGEELTYDMVLTVLGAADTSTFAKLFTALNEDNTVDVLKAVDAAVTDGKELSQFTTDFLWFMRNLLVIKTASDVTGIIDASSENIEAMREAAAGTSKESLVRYIRTIAELVSKMRYSNQKRVLLELTLIQLMTSYQEVEEEPLPVKKVFKKINREVLEPEVIKLARAQYDDLMKLKNDWPDFIRELSGVNKVLMKETTVETNDGDAMLICFNSRDVFNMPHRDKAIAEIAEIAAEKYGREFTFRAKLIGKDEAVSKYVTEEELSSLVNMEIEIEEE